MAGLYPFVDVNLHASDSSYALLSPSNPNAPTLVIDRPSGDIRLSDGKISGTKRISAISGILGIVKLRLDKYLIVITKSQPVGKLRGSTIYKIISTDLLPLHERQLHDKDEDTYLSLLRTTLKASPMYFSYNTDLTNSFQRQARADPGVPLWQRADDRFFWNKYLAQDLINFREGIGSAAGIRVPTGAQPAVDPYILPVMSGTMSLTRTAIKGNPLTFLLITRKSRHRVGTRYFSRGMDEQGHVANFNETEQIVAVNDTDTGFASANGAASDVQIFSYVQTRGSVPAYWAEINTLKYTPKLQIRGIDTAVDAAKQHFDEQIQTYGDNYLINLVNQKGREKGVKDAYEQMVRKLQSTPAVATDEKGQAPGQQPTVGVIESTTNQSEFDRLHYVYFDFHTETKGLKWHRAQLLLDQLHEPLHKQGYFHGVYQSPNSKSPQSQRVEIRSLQRSVARTNCMDCLDRTNVIQSMLGRQSLDRQLTDLSILRRGESASEDVVFNNEFRNVWADNADTVSRSYSGTGALKTDFTRTGNRTRAGALQDLNNSITRYVRNNFLDGPRQDGYDLLTGAYVPDAVQGSLVFTDRRPLAVQAMPFIFAAGVFFLLVAEVTSQLPDHGIWPLRVGVVLSTLVACYAINFIFSYGTLYVNWPKLNTPVWAQEAYSDALSKATKDPVVGSLLQQDTKRGDGRQTYLAEEGKKRIE